MSILVQSLIGAFLVSLISLSGVLVLGWKEKFLQKILIFLVSFSAGAMLGAAFFHLLPEALENFQQPGQLFQYTLLGMIIFFVLEKILRWRHCHEITCETHHHLGYLNLVGDGVHNLLDGIIIYSAFAVNVGLGLATLISIILHEIPQEIGDFGVLIYAGWQKKKAVLMNLFSALFALVGVLISFCLIKYVANINNFLLPLAAGGFIYIAASDLIPEIHKETKLFKSFLTFIFFLAALALMFLTGE